MKYDYLIVGSGLYGLVVSRMLTNKGYKCLIIDKRDTIGGNIVDENIDGILVHSYGPHVFHTNSEEVWEFVNKYSKWSQYTLQTIAKSNGNIYNLPFNMNTFYKIFNVQTPAEVQEKINNEINLYGVENPTNLEEQAIKLVGKTVYELLIKGYTEKQWGKPCTELEPFIIKRLPLRLTFDNRYFNDKYCAIPDEGYSQFAKNIVSGINGETSIDYILNIDFKTFIDNTEHTFDNIIYTGMPDELCNYELGPLEWRSLYFVIDEIETNNVQGSAIVNYTTNEEKYTRSVEHKHFYPNKVYNNEYTIITYEFPDKWDTTKEAYYPVNNENTTKLYNEYVKLIKEKYPNMQLGGRLGNYVYYDMDKCILAALNSCK